MQRIPAPRQGLTLAFDEDTLAALQRMGQGEGQPEAAGAAVGKQVVRRGGWGCRGNIWGGVGAAVSSGLAATLKQAIGNFC